jgi:hydroxymethylpyrimidine/phosphomethylpyrimidine kinase
MHGRVLVIAGSDSGGGAGIQADIKSVTALAGYAMTAITALTAQNTEGVFGIHAVPEDFVRRQIELCLADIGADCIKTGMLATAGVIATVTKALAEFGKGIPLVADPVMVAKGGAPLLEPAAVDAVRRLLLPRATLITPNLPEAETLTGRKIASGADMQAAGAALLALGPKAVLMKGGHLPGPLVHDVLVTDGEVRVFESPRIETRHTHGTGCTLASAISAGIAQGLPLADAVARARAYVQAAIKHAPGYGKGHGPLDHAVTVDPTLIEEGFREA